MKEKKIILIGISSVFVMALLITTLTLTLGGDNDNVLLSDNANDKNLINNSFLTLMLEQSDGTYKESTSNTWPSGNYAFNETLSRCENGGELKWDREKGIVNLLSNKSDACYVYFDLYNAVEITDVNTTKTTNSVTLTVTVEAGENPIATYYFSMDGGNSYQESNTNTYTFSNLDNGTTYTFQVYVVDTEGYESNEEVIEVTTDNYVNPVVNSVTATSVTNNTITVSVSASAGTNAIGTYMYSINNGSYTSSSSNTHTFSGLSAGTSYTIKVKVKDTNNIESSEYTIITKTEDTVLLADYIKSKYTSQSSNGLYYHTSSLANSAGDNSYRYAGANPNNYVCFGSSAATCPSNNLYRIIGVFGDEVKLIMADYPTTSQTGTIGAYFDTYSRVGLSSSNYKGNQSLSSVGTYYWNRNPSGSNTWSSSSLVTTNLNTTFLNNISSIWRNKIADKTWFVNGYGTYNATPKEFYNAESSGTTWSGKVGLIYVSDYGYAASNSLWSTIMGSYYKSSITSNNWMYMGLDEWTISRCSSSNSYAYRVNNSGNVYYHYSDYLYYRYYAIRPCFYLISSTQYVSGSGTQSDPIRIN